MSRRFNPTLAAGLPGLLATVVLLLLLLLQSPQSSLAGVKQKLYLIQGIKVTGVVNATSQLRNFLSMNLDGHQRCQRYAILLYAYRREGSALTNFQIADVASLRKEEAEKRFNSYDIEVLRDLYITGIQSYLDAHFVNSAATEIYKCLDTSFRNRDARARSFLNNEETKTIIGQYNAIAEQPVKLLAEGHAKHPEIKLEELHPTVRNSLAKWFPGDESKLESIFDSTDKWRGQEQRRQESSEAAAVAAHAGGHASAIAAADAQTGGAAAAAAADDDDDDASYLGYVFGSIIATYESLPIETSLSERCRAYSEIVEAEKDDLFRETFVSELVQNAAQNLARPQAAEPYVPDQTKRENFLFVLQTLDPLQGGSEAWTDMVDCVRQWEAVDPEAARFMHSPELAQTFKDILALTNETGDAAHVSNPAAVNAAAHSGQQAVISK